ncbi:hypothetical protein [Thalassoglobus polymorphus]|nr:hypothetical protein [Thalassoglobus polymorphus]
MFHALFGCCLHHTHGHAAHGHFAEIFHSSDQPEEVIDEHSHSHRCKSDVSPQSVKIAHCEQHESEKNEQEHDDHAPCGEVDCQFVSTPRTDDVTLPDPLSLDAALGGMPPFQIALSPLQSGNQFKKPADHPFETQSLHLFKQVWQL